MKDIDKIIDYCTEYFSKYDFSSILQKIDTLKYMFPIPDNMYNHTLEDWGELYDGEEMHWKIPNTEELNWVISNLAIDTLWEEGDNSFLDINIIYKGDLDFEIDTSKLDEQIVELEQMRKDWEYDAKNVLPNKSYVGNCSKEFCERIVDKFWEREYDRIQYIDFPPIEFNIPTIKKCQDEFIRLYNNPGSLNSKNGSNIVKYFHKSIVFASTGNKLSPFDGWQYIKSDPEVFKDFYRNRLRCSDWFKGEGRLDYLLRGVVMENTYGIGLSTSRKYQIVTYFKPKLAKYIIQKYLDNYDTIFDPFSGYSGRMIGALVSRKSYIGQDLCKYSIDESKEIYEFIKELLPDDVDLNVDLSVKNSIKEYGKYECLFTCPPYGNIEKWPDVESVNYSCDKWIDICISHYDCDKYVFVVDDKIQKYKKYIKETITNTSHFMANAEYIVVIDKEDLKDIVFDNIDGDIIESDTYMEFTNLAQNLYNIFNQKIFNKTILAPDGFTEWINLIYNKFGFEKPIIYDNGFDKTKINLNENNKDVLLACSGGLDSIYQIFQLKELGYNVILYHMKGANLYENNQSLVSLKELAEKLNLELVVPVLKHRYNLNYSKSWPENPIKNQMILLSMVDYCRAKGINRVSIDGSWEFPIEQTTAGIDVTDAPENCDLLLDSLNKYINNLVYIRTEHVSKIEKIKYLDSIGLMDYVYSCLGPGKFNEYRHNKVLEKYKDIKLFKHNCGNSCRKCAHHNLLMYYSKYREFPEEFIEKCWNMMSENGFPSRKFLFDKNIPIEERIKNLYIE